MSFLKSKHSGWTWDMKRTPYMGGGGGGSPGPSTTYSNTSNIPEYAKPYVETMLGATQKQLFTLDDQNQVTGFQQYRPYSSNVNDYVAGFSPLQQQAQSAAANLQVPGQYGAASGLAGASGLGSMGIAGQAAGAGQQYAQQVTNPYAVQQYMSPYQQNVTDVAKNAAVREARIAENINKLGAARQGTYGGARQLLGSTERERNLLSNLSNIQAQGSQSAYDRAIQSQQFGANLGLQGYGTALQGLGQAGQAASTLGGLGTAQLAAQQGILGTQAQQGAQQQALEQSKINQAIQDYAIQQQYPLMQLGFMSNMLRGLPMQAQTTQLYQAQPSTLQQGIGLVGAGASLFGAGAGKAAGGEIKEMAEGGIAGYKYGKLISGPKLESMADKLNPEELQARLKDPQLDRSEREVFEDALAEKAKDKARYAGIGAAGGGLFDTMGYAGGGILAFADEGAVKDPEKLAEQINLVGAQLDAVTKEVGGRTAPGSKQRAFAPEKVVEFENLQKRKSELQSEYADLMAKAGLDKPAVGYRSGVAPTTLYPNSTEQALLGTKPPETRAMPTEGEFKAFDEATQRYLAEQKAKPPGAAGPSAGAEGSKPSDASGGVGTGPTSSLGGILANLRKEGPQGTFGADRLADLAKFESGADKRLSRSKDLAQAMGFLEFGGTAAPGGIGQAGIAGLKKYTEGYGKALESDEKYREELSKQKQDVLALQRAEERGDVKLAAELQDKIADRANRLQTANISAAASRSSGAREDAYVKQLMAQGMSLQEALQAVKGAGKVESNDIQKAKLLLKDINDQLFALGADPKKNAAKIAELEQQRNAINQAMSVGGTKIAGGGGGGNLVANKDGSFNYVP